MVKYLIKSTQEILLSTMSDVEQFHKNIQKDAEQLGCTLSSFSWKEVVTKEKGEIVDISYCVKYTYVFNTVKEPEVPLQSITYNLYDKVADNYDGE
jgi:hypothetical protein